MPRTVTDEFTIEYFLTGEDPLGPLVARRETLTRTIVEQEFEDIIDPETGEVTQELGDPVETVQVVGVDTDGWPDDSPIDGTPTTEEVYLEAIETRQENMIAAYQGLIDPGDEGDIEEGEG